MTDTAAFYRLSRHWIYWSGLGHLGDVSVSTPGDDGEILFSSDQYSVHLRHEDGRWVVDNVDDRGRRQNAIATFSSYALAEKYLIWIWASAARSAIGAPNLDRALYNAGRYSGIEAKPVNVGSYELRSIEGSAVVAEPYATIFSHLMDKPEEEIEQMVRAGVG